MKHGITLTTLSNPNMVISFVDNTKVHRDIHADAQTIQNIRPVINISNLQQTFQIDISTFIFFPCSPAASRLKLWNVWKL